MTFDPRSLFLVGMGEHIFKVRIDELTTIRFVCQKCGSKVEFSVADPPRALRSGNCPCCNETTADSGIMVGQLSALCEAINALSTNGVQSLEFPVPMPE